MRLVENHRRVVRKHRAVSAVTQSQVRKEEVMIHDDYVRIDRPLPHARDEARIEVRTFLAQTGIRPRIDVPPERKILRQVRKFSPVARFGAGDPVKYFIKLIDLFEPFEKRHALSALDPMQTDVI